MNLYRGFFYDQQRIAEEEQNNINNSDKTPDVEYRYNNLAGSQNNILNNNTNSASSPITRKTISMKTNTQKYDKSRPNGYKRFKKCLNTEIFKNF